MPDEEVKQYTKADFLTNTKTAKKFNISKEEAKKVLKQLFLKQTKVQFYTRAADNRKIFVRAYAVIINQTMDRSTEYLLHPAAHNIFLEQLNKSKQKDSR